METLANSIPIGATGKLQNNIAMPYQFTIGSLMQESWKRVKGTKKTYWGAFLLCIAIYAALFSLGLLATYLYAGSLNPDLRAVKISSIITRLLITLITFPLFIGISLIPIYRSVNLPIRIKQLFISYQFYWKLLAVMAMIYTGMTLIVIATLFAASFHFAFTNNMTPAWFYYYPIIVTTIGTFIAVYFLFSISNAPLLIIEKRFGIFQAIKTSFLAFKQHGLKIIAAVFCFILIYFISFIPLGIGLIWTLPMLYNSMGILYRIQFGVGEVSN